MSQRREGDEPILLSTRINRFLPPSKLFSSRSTARHLVPIGSRASRTSIKTSLASNTFRKLFACSFRLGSATRFSPSSSIAPDSANSSSSRCESAARAAAKAAVEASVAPEPLRARCASRRAIFSSSFCKNGHNEDISDRIRGGIETLPHTLTFSAAASAKT